MTSPTRAVPSEFRAQCVHASVCPGCPLIRDTYGEQLARKAARVSAVAAAFPELTPVAVEPTRPAEQAEGYRTRAKLVAGPDGALGLFARGSHELVDLPECRVLHPVLSRVTASLRLLSAGSGLAGVDLALVGEAVMLTLIAPSEAPRTPLVALARELSERESCVVSVAISRRKPNAVQLLGGEHEVVLGPAELRANDPSEKTYHYAAHGAFQQVHAETASTLYARVAGRVRTAAAGSTRVLELYAGSGALSLALARQGARVLAVESFGPACERLARAAREQALGLEVREGDAGAVARTLSEQGARFDVVLVNPPRRGLDVQVRQAIAQLAPQHVAYVSCNPATLGRDLAHWARLGFITQQLEPFDMMPLTDQVETFAWLSRTLPASVERLALEHDFDGDLLAVSKGPHQATANEAQGPALPALMDRVRALFGYERAVPWFPLEPQTSGVALFARDERCRARLQACLSAAGARYEVLAKGVLHKRGKLGLARTAAQGSMAEARYQRLGVERGHSLVRFEFALPDPSERGGYVNEQLGDIASALRNQLARIGHPVIGDGRHDRATRTHFEMRHGLDRPFVHRTGLTLVIDGKQLAIEVPVAPDLALVLASLRERVNAA